MTNVCPDCRKEVPDHIVHLPGLRRGCTWKDRADYERERMIARRKTSAERRAQRERNGGAEQ